MIATSSDPAEEAIDDLLRGGRLTCGKITIGPLGPNAVKLLRVLWPMKADLTNKNGADQTATIRRAYAVAGEKKIGEITNLLAEKSSNTSDSFAAPVTPVRKWRLHRLRSCSIRGLAPLGEIFAFEFDGESILIYGPNGSGKSSILNAVGWVLTGRVVTDSEDPSETVPLYTAPTELGRESKKLRDWPTIHTLPIESDLKKERTDCWAELKLRTTDGTDELILRRSLANGLEESDDGETWNPCTSLVQHGITPLDIHLSVSAATVFGRKSIEAAEDSRTLLSMMLGYDQVQEMGTLVTALATALTKSAKVEREALSDHRESQRTLLASLPDKLREGLELRLSVTSLVGNDLPEEDRVAEIVALAAADIETAERTLASILGIGGEGHSVPAGLADSLTSAVRLLESPLSELFPELISTLPALSSSGPNDLVDLLSVSAGTLANFEESAAVRISERLTWFLKESALGSKDSLLIQAAEHFDPEQGTCPVCEQEIIGLEVEKQLRGLKGGSADLRSSIREFFRDLADEVRKIVPASFFAIANKFPSECIRNDWSQLRKAIGTLLAPIIDRFEARINGLIDSIPKITVSESSLLTDKSDQRYVNAATPFLNVLNQGRMALAIAHWATDHREGILKLIAGILTCSDLDGDLCLLDELARGKHAAADVGPIMAVRNLLSQVAKELAVVRLMAAELTALEEIQSALNELKTLSGYVAAKIENVFSEIKDKTLENYHKLRPEVNPTLSLSRLHMNKGRDKTVEAYLSSGNYEVSGQHIASAGVLRAIALAFYFALLERHPGGLGFVMMDDPILSLDDDHREAWAANILQPALVSTQFILATHQLQFLNNCSSDFHPGRLVELNSRDLTKRVTFRPGGRLDRAEGLLKTSWRSVANELRKYREDLLITLDTYSPSGFFNSSKLRQSLDAYAALVKPHPLASAHQITISTGLRSTKISRVLDPGSHSKTEAEVTEPMVEECLRELRTLDQMFRKELERLESERLRLLKGRAFAPAISQTSCDISPTAPAAIPFERLKVGEASAAWRDSLRLRIIGAAAAQTRGCVVDFAETPSEADFPPGGAVLVASETLCPIARPRQWALIANDDEEAGDGDLAAIRDQAGNRYLRRVWSSGDSWLLEAVNSLAGVPPISIRKCECKLQKICGVCFGPSKEPSRSSGRTACEWSPRHDFQPGNISRHFGITVEGTSLEPIALDKQIVLVSEKLDRLDAVARGSLAVVDTEDDNVGSVIKRVYPNDRAWLMVSPNTIEPRDPIMIARNKIRAVWPVCGVLFSIVRRELGESDF